MKTVKPTYKELVASLGTLLAECSAVDEMLETFSSETRTSVTAARKRTQRQLNHTRTRIQRVYVRAAVESSLKRHRSFDDVDTATV